MFLLTDAPHLVKKGRNNLEKSFSGTGQRRRTRGRWAGDTAAIARGGRERRGLHMHLWTHQSAPADAELAICIPHYPVVHHLPCGVAAGKAGGDTRCMHWWMEEERRWTELHWSHVRTIVEWDLHNSPQIMKNVFLEHVMLTSWTRMRCHLSTQLFHGLVLIAAWAEAKGWEHDGTKQPPAAILLMIKNLAGYARWVGGQAGGWAGGAMHRRR